MNKLFVFFSLSLCLHLVALFGLGGLSRPDLPLNFSKNLGKSMIRARLKVSEKVKADFTSEKKGKLKKLERKAPRKKDQLTDISENERESGSEERLTKYLGEIRELILKNKFKSPIASRLNLKGTAKISFKIESPARLKDLRLIESSGKKPLDDSALRTVRGVGDFPIIPEALGLKELTITLEMEFE